MLRDIGNPRLLYLKGGLMLLCGLLASAGLFLDNPTLRTVVLIAIAVWGFCRAYYFAFYVVQHYADPEYRFAGLIHFARYCLSRRKRPPDDPA